jgi:hypothetical protein
MDRHELIANEYKKRYQKILGKSAVHYYLHGCSSMEIDLIEAKYNLCLPRSYRVFLENFGHYPSQFLADINLEYPYPLTQTEDLFYPMLSPSPEDKYIPPVEIPEKLFVISNYYGQDIDFFIADGKSDDPEIFRASTDQGDGEVFKYERFASSIWDFLEDIVKCKEKTYKV